MTRPVSRDHLIPAIVVSVEQSRDRLPVDHLDPVTTAHPVSHKIEIGDLASRTDAKFMKPIP